jgi:hypothetical protein
MPRLSAARVKLPISATVTNMRRGSGGVEMIRRDANAETEERTAFDDGIQVAARLQSRNLWN